MVHSQCKWQWHIYNTAKFTLNIELDDETSERPLNSYSSIIEVKREKEPEPEPEVVEESASKIVEEIFEPEPVVVPEEKKEVKPVEVKEMALDNKGTLGISFAEGTDLP